jgi:hypothetical protein
MSRVETKVWAAVVGAGGGTVVGNALLWFLGVVAWGAPSDAAHSKQALDAVPPYLSSLITLALAAIGTFGAGYFAPPSNHAGNSVGGVMDDADAGHEHLATGTATGPLSDTLDGDDDDEPEVGDADSVDSADTAGSAGSGDADDDSREVADASAAPSTVVQLGGDRVAGQVDR